MKTFKQHRGERQKLSGDIHAATVYLDMIAKGQLDMSKVNVKEVKKLIKDLQIARKNL